MFEEFPEKYTAKTTSYTPGILSNFSEQLRIEKGDLSQEDIDSLLKLLPYGIKYEAAKLLQTKRQIDYALIEDLLTKYNKLLSIKTKSKRLEDKWQKFFEDNILYFNFGYVEKFDKEKIQGDKKINIPDFIMLNNYGYLDVFEIKTHLSILLSYDTGRKNFYWTAEAAKALSQAENYTDCITKEEYTLIKNIRDEYTIEVDAVRPIVYVIASTKNTLTSKGYKGALFKKLKNDFRRLNNSLKNVRIVLYDELLESFENMLKTLDKNPKN